MTAYFGGTLQVKLCDFGFTREYERNKLLQTFCGTVCYSAPEMLKGERYMAYGTGWFCFSLFYLPLLLRLAVCVINYFILDAHLLNREQPWTSGH